MTKWYSVEELAEILSLHPRTVQRFIREGKIQGKKLGRAWKVSQDALRDYAHDELAVRQEDAPKYAAENRGLRTIQVSTVIELWEQENEEASRISNSLIAMLNQKDPAWGKVHYDLIYHPEEGRARFVLNGSPQFIGQIMEFFQIIMENRNGK